MHPGVFVRSVYFQDPDGILLEFAAWTKVFTEADVNVAPARPAELAATGSLDAPPGLSQHPTSRASSG